MILFSGFIALLVYQDQKATSGADALAVESRPTPARVSDGGPQGLSNAAASNTAANSVRRRRSRGYRTGVAVGSANATTSTTTNEAPQPETCAVDAAAAKPADQQPLVAAAPPQMSPQPLKDEPASTTDRDAKAEKERNADKLDIERSQPTPPRKNPSRTSVNCARPQRPRRRRSPGLNNSKTMRQMASLSRMKLLTA